MTNAGDSSGSSTDSAEARLLQCPRCGHGLDGNAAAAAARAETRGLCTECGLPVEWSVLRRDAIGPVWFVESARPARTLPRRAIGTLVRCARPFRFWGAIDLALPRSLVGFAAFLLAVAAALHLVAVGSRVDELQQRRVPNLLAIFPGSGAGSAITAELALVALSPASTFSGAQLLKYAQHGDNAGSGLAFVDVLRAFGIAILAPWKGAITLFDGWSAGQGRRVPVYAIGFEQPLLPQNAPMSLLAAAGIATLAPFAILLLPASLRRAKVRRAHVIRIAVFGASLLVPIFAGSVALPHLDASYREFSIDLWNSWGLLNAHLLLLGWAGLLAAAWTTAAASRYLKLPNAAGIGAACASIAVLVAVHALAAHHFAP